MKMAVIPARGGSKRIPRKNVKPFRGKPIIAYSIEAAKTSQLFDRIIVSTDDEEIAQVAQKWGAEVPFTRPKELADDYTGTTAVTLHALHWTMEAGHTLTHICCIYPTAPFVQPQDLDQAFQLMSSKQADHCFPIVAHPSAIQRAIRLEEGKRVQMFHPENRDVRSQDLQPAYYDAGQFYWSTSGALLDGTPVLSKGAVGLVVPQWRVCDIDTPEDWRRAELMHELLERGRPS